MGICFPRDRDPTKDPENIRVNIRIDNRKDEVLSHCPLKFQVNVRADKNKHVIVYGMISYSFKKL